MLGRRAKGTPPACGTFNPSLPQPLQGTSQAFRPDFDLTHPKDWPTWLQNCHTENAAVEVMKDGTVIWWGGTMHDGLWMPKGPAYWMGGCWRDGIVLGGVFEQCDWYYGEKRGGNFRTRVRWYDGIHRGGKFEGLWLGGLWLGGEFCAFKNRSLEPPNQIIDDESFVGRHRLYIGMNKELAGFQDGTLKQVDQMNPAIGNCEQCGRKLTILYPHMEGERREYLCGECENKRLTEEVNRAEEKMKTELKDLEKKKRK